MWIKYSSALILVFLSSTLFSTQSSGQTVPTQPTYFIESCSTNSGNYSSNSSYSTNLKTALSTLQQQATASPFYHVSAGSVVHAQYYCRADIDSNLCSTCVQQAADTILRNCSNFKSAVIWYDVCTLRYRNESMFGQLSTGSIGYSWSKANVSDPDSFSILVNTTLDRLINESAYSNDFRRFGVSDVAVSGSESAYFLVQCSPDMNATECERCLRVSYDYIPRCCGNWPVRARVFLPSCQLRYSNSLFYYGPSTPAPPPEMFSSPPPPPPPPPLALQPSPPPPAITTLSPTGDGTKTGSSERVKAGLAVIGVVVLTFLANI